MKHAAIIQRHHLDRTAMIYVRQSTPKQLLLHQESKRHPGLLYQHRPLAFRLLDAGSNTAVDPSPKRRPELISARWAARCATRGLLVSARSP